MNIVKYDPWKRLSEMENRMNRFFNAPLFTDNPTRGTLCTGSWSPRVDLLEEDGRFVIHADLPGVRNEDVSIDVEDGVLTLKGERKPGGEVKEESYYRQERSYGCFARKFSVPSSVDTDAISAAFKDGVLRIEIPKPEEAKAKRVAIH
jgi:HSP20 family protein